MTVKFITVKGSENVGRSPFYIGVAQHERTMPKRETYEYCAERTGYKPLPSAPCSWPRRSSSARTSAGAT